MNQNVQYNPSARLFVRRSIGYLLLSSLILLSSCIRDNDLEPCPPLQVQLTVKDKNYFNVDKVDLEPRKSETLPFSEYVPTLFYALRNASTGEILEEQGVFNVTGSEPTIPLTFCSCLPLGTYILTVWGGLPDNTRLTDNSLTGIIHPSGVEGNDIYLAHDTLVYDLQHTNYTIGLERVTGKLLTQVVDLPATTTYADNSVSQIYERVTHQFNYLNPLTVSKQHTWQSAPEIVLSTILAPSTGDFKSLLHVNFYNAPGWSQPDLTPKDAYITMKRNELTVLKYVYDEEKNDFMIYLLMNDTWTLIYDLDID